MNEHDICWLKNSDYAEVTTPSGTAWKSKLMRYLESHPEEVKLIAENKDDSALFHVPVNWIKCGPLRKVSEEQKAAAGERLRQMWEDRKSVEEYEQY